MLAALLLFATAPSGAEGLLQAAEAAAGHPLRLDPRIAVPPCPEPFRFEPQGDRGLRARCPATGWTLLLPSARAAARPAAPALVRRGDPVRVRAGGPGFEVRIDGVAASSGAIGDRVRVKLPHGAELVAEVTAEGGLMLAGRP